MKNSSKESQKKENQDFVEEYEKIVNYSENSVVIVTEWSKNGDYFQKLTMYDNSYVPIFTLGNTTLIKAF